MTRHLLEILILAVFLTSCATTPPASPQPIVFTVAPSAVPSPTLWATSTPPASSPVPPLHTQGPYLLFTRDNKTLVIMDADGTGSKRISLPDEGYTFMPKAVSPDGHWIAYFTGSTQEPYDLALQILNLSEETTQTITPVLAPSFPENLNPLLQTMVLGDPPVYPADCFADMACRRSLVQQELTNSIFALDWSPDSQSLAFTAQIDGPSSDIYIYTPQDNAIRQFTNEPENIYSLDWAPNGHSLLYKINSTPGLGYEGSQWRLIDRQGTPIPFSEDLDHGLLRWEGHDWLADNLYLLLLFSDVEPSFSHFKVLNTDTGQIKEIWADTAHSFAMNRQNQTIVVLHKNDPHEPFKTAEGIYMVSAQGKYRKIGEVGFQFALFEGERSYPIFMENYDSQLYSIKSDGSIQSLPWEEHRLRSIAPDEKILLFRKDNTLALYSSSHELLKSWPMEDNIYSAVWNPDSSGVFIFTDVNAYYLAVSDEAPQPLLESCAPQRCERTRFVWLP